MHRLSILVVFQFTLFLFPHLAFNQTPGEIFYPSSGTSTFLDPDADGYITSSGSAFAASNEQAQFEGQWSTRFQITTEPSGDAATGAGCASTDIVDEPTNKVSMYTGIYDPDGYPSNNDGDEYFLARLRIGKSPGTANFGYSILIDSDNLFGSGSDGNYISGNGGFEVEIRLKNGGGAKGVFLDDVDGTTSGTNKASYSITTHHQKSYAKYTSTGCTNDPIFVDVAVPFSDLDQYFGLTPNSIVRVVGATTTSGASALSSNVSDLSGTDDDDPSYITIEDAILDIVDNQPTTQTLPVDLISVELKTNPFGNRYLTWSTATEVNTDFFEVQLSSDGIAFRPIGQAFSKGTAISGSQYEFYDLPNPEIDQSQYIRLKMVDYDGFTEYSVILELSQAKNEHQVFNIFPNPCRGNLHIENAPENASFHLFDHSGSLVRSGEINGDNIDLNELKDGSYVIEIKSSTSIRKSNFLLTR